MVITFYRDCISTRIILEATAALQKEWMKIGKALVPIFNQIGQKN